MTVVTPVSTLSKNNPWRVVSNFISGTVDVFDFTSAIHLLSYSLHVRYFVSMPFVSFACVCCA